MHLTTGPLYHSGPLAWALLTHALGGTVVLLRRFDAGRWVELVREHRVTNTFTAPTPLKRIVALPDDVLASADLSSMRSLVVNAAPGALRAEGGGRRAFGDGFLFEVYGSTELGVDAVLPPEEQLARPGSCGKALPGVELRVVDDEGAAAARGGAGACCRSARPPRSPATTAGSGSPTAGSPSATSRTSTPTATSTSATAPGDLVITGGMNVYPAEVEAVLHDHPDVLDAAVYGLPSAEWGETVHAVVVPRDGRALAIAERWRRTSRSGSPTTSGPRSWQVRAALPRTESGKLLKRLLRAEHGTFEVKEFPGQSAGVRSGAVTVRHAPGLPRVAARG